MNDLISSLEKKIFLIFVYLVNKSSLDSTIKLVSLMYNNVFENNFDLV